MRIGIDVSQAQYQGTGVGQFVMNLVKDMIAQDKENEYVLFAATLRGKMDNILSQIVGSSKNVTIKQVKIPPRLLDVLWNRLHVLPIEYFVGKVDIFVTSDWTEPPAKRAKKATILYDLIVYKHPKETDETIAATQKRKLKWVVRESSAVLCISESTKRDAADILHIPVEKLHVIKPGLTL